MKTKRPMNPFWFFSPASPLGEMDFMYFMYCDD